MRNYLIVLFRNLRRERLYAAINIAGLALGIACCLILGLFLKSELTYDRHFTGYEHIYRVVNEFTTGGKTRQVRRSPRAALGPDDGRGIPGRRSRPTYASRAMPTTADAVARAPAATSVFYWKNSYFVDPNVFEVLPAR